MKYVSLRTTITVAVLIDLMSALLAVGGAQADHDSGKPHWPSVRMEWNYGVTGGAKFGTMNKTTAWAVPIGWRSHVETAATNWKEATGLEIVGPVSLQNHQVQGLTLPKGTEVYFQRRNVGAYDDMGCDDSMRRDKKVAVGCAVWYETTGSSDILGSVVVLLIERNYDKGFYPTENGEFYWKHEGWQLTTDCNASRPSSGAKGR